MKHILTLSIFFVFLFSLAHGQSIVVTGKLTSKGETLPFVAIAVEGKTTGTTTDLEGQYRLSGLSADDVLVFSFIGCRTQKIRVANQRVINVELEPDTKEVEEVVVTALGIKRQEREIGYSTERIESKMIERSQAPNIVSAMTGRAAGVQVSNGDGVDGGSTRITIRGNNNISEKNQPLIVVDGVQMENTPGLTNVGRGQDWGSAINNINPSDIESMNILKGGAASALYGSRGANGVIEITTKKGTIQKGLGVTYSMNYKWIVPYRFREVQNKYGAGGPISFTPPTFPVNAEGVELYPGMYGTDHLVINQAGDVSNTTDEFGYYGSAVSWGPRMDGREVLWWDGRMRSYSPQPDNLKWFFNNGKTITHNVAVSGGNEKGTLRLSLTDSRHTPIIDNSNYRQTTINLGSSLNVSRKIKVDVTASYMNYYRLNSPILGESGDSFNKGILYSWPRSYQGVDMRDYQNPDGTMNLQEGYPFFYINPYLWWNFYNNNQELDRNKLIGSISLKYDITKWLYVTGRTALDFNIDNFTTRKKPTDLVGVENGYYANSLARERSMNHDVLFTAFKDSFLLSDLNVQFSAGGARIENNLYGINGNSGKWYYPNMYTFSNYTPYQILNNQVVQAGSYSGLSESYSRRRTNSVYSFLNIDFRNYLFLQLTGRNDWSSTLPPNSNSFFYPSVSLSYIATEALDIKTPWLNFLKIRGGVAQTATDALPYQTEFYYSTSLFGGDQTSAFPSVIPPYALKPQRVNSFEGGATFGFLDNRIDLDLTLYYNYSFDQIISAPVPVSSGASGVQINEGVLTNRGIEIILNTVPYQGKDLVVRAGLNFSRNRNFVKSLGEYANEYPLADIWGLNGPAMVLREGDEFGTIYGYDHLYDANGRPIVNDEGTKYMITDTRVPIGNASPAFLAGFTTDVRYKNFRLSSLIDTKWGGDIYCGSYVIALQTGQSPETLLERDGGGLPYLDPAGETRPVGVVLDGVHADGTPNTTVVHYYYKYLPNAGGWGKFLSRPGIIENTWVKVREIAISYDLPASLAAKTGVFQELSFSLIGRDLWYLYTTLPDKINPEGIMGSGNAQGFEWSSYPSTRSFIFSIQAKF